MSLKNLLVTFVTSEEARITQRSAMSMGATLSIVLAVAILTIGLTAQSPHAIDVRQCCSGAGGTMYKESHWVDWRLCNPQCMEQRKEERWCCSDPMCGCEAWYWTDEYRVLCTGQPICYGRCEDCI